MRLFEIFRDLMVFGDDIGKVKRASMYEDSCYVDGTDNEGNKFSLSVSITKEPVCENNNEEVKIDDSI